MPDGWRETTLGEVATSSPRRVPAAGSGLPYYGLEHFDSGSSRIARSGNSEAIEGAGVPVLPGDVMFSKLRPYLNKVAVAEEAAVASTEVLVYRPSTEHLHPAYLGLVLQDDRAIKHAVALSAGSRMPRTTAKAMAGLSVALPPLGEQRRIVDLIAAVDDAVEAAKAEAESSAAARRSMWAATASRTVRLSDVGDVSQGRALPRDLQGTKTGDISWFKIADMTRPGNELGYTIAETQVSAAVLAARGGKVAPAGSVVFPRVGAAVATEKKRLLEAEAALDENHIVVTPKMPNTSRILLAAFESIRLGDLARKGAVPSINMSLVRSLDIPWLPEQTDAGAVDLMLSESRALERCARQTAVALRILRLNLLTVLLSGEHEIPSSYDALLEG